MTWSSALLKATHVSQGRKKAPMPCGTGLSAAFKPSMKQA